MTLAEAHTAAFDIADSVGQNTIHLQTLSCLLVDIISAMHEVPPHIDAIAFTANTILGVVIDNLNKAEEALMSVSGAIKAAAIQDT